MPLWRDHPEAWHEVQPGVRRRILAHAPETMLVLYHIEPDRVFAKHSHRHAQSGTILEGGGRFEAGGTTWTVGPGDAYYIPPDVPHEFRSRKAERSVIVDVFVPRRDDFLGEARRPDEP